MSERARVAFALRDTAGVAKRNLLRIARTPLMLIVTAVQPALLLLLFRYVLGGDTLEVRVRHAQDLERAAALVAEMVRAQPRTDANEQRLSVPTKGGTALLIAAGRRLEEAGIELDDLGIHRPSLDDVFLTLTGSATGKDEAR